jgi:hypothetical protein
MDILFGPIPSGFVESSIETIWTRGGITSHVFDNRVQFIKIRGGVGKVSEILIGKG